MASNAVADRPARISRIRSTGSRRINRPSVVLAVILTVQLMVVLDATIVNVALPDIQNALHFSDTQLSWVLNGYTLTFGGLLLLGARCGDLLGRRTTFLSGIAVFSAASLLGGFATAGWWLLAARALQGVGGALAAPSALALLTTMFPEGRERVRAIGLFTVVSIGGAAIGLILGGMLTQWASWRWVLFVNVPVGVVVLLLGRSILVETPKIGGRFDLGGALTSVTGIGSLVFGFVNAGTEGWSNDVTVAAFVAGVVLTAAFVLIELRAQQPITPLHLLSDPTRTAANVARGLLFAGMYGQFFFLTQFLQEILGYSSLAAGFAFLPIPVCVFIFSQLTARVLVNRIQAKTLMLIGASLAVIGLAVTTRIDAHSSYPSIVLGLALFGAGNGISFVTMTTAALSGVAPAEAGAASGLINVMQQLGGTLGVAVLVTVFGSSSKHAETHPGVGPHGGSNATRIFVYGLDHALFASTLFAAAAWLLVALVVRRPAAQADLGMEEGAPAELGAVGH